MGITQRLMANGDFQIRLTEQAPLSKRTKIREWDAIAIFETASPTPISHFTNAEVLAQSIYTGIVTSYDRRNGVLIGQEGSCLLGRQDGDGDRILTPITKTAGTLDQWLTDILASGQSNGITKGTVTNTGTTLTWTTPIGISQREAITYVCRMVGAEWVFQPDFTIDAAAQATLFPAATRPVVITEQEEGRDGGYIGLEGSLSAQTDIDDYATGVICVAQGAGSTIATGAATSGDTTYKAADGNNLVMERLIDSPTTPGANAGTAAQSALNLWSTARSQVIVQSRTYAPSRFANRGDTVYPYDLIANLQDAANQIVYRGELLTPMALRVFALSFELVKGMGVYVRRATGAGSYTWTDLSDCIAWEVEDPLKGGTARWEVGGIDKAVFPDQTGVLSAATLGASPGIAERANAPGLVGYAQVTADQATITTVVDLTSLTLTWTARADRRYRITGKVEVTATAADGAYQVLVTDGSNNAKQRATDACLTTSSRMATVISVETGLSGSTTRKLRMSKNGGTGSLTMSAASTQPAFILVEDIGPA